jgi:hypothetical protein
LARNRYITDITCPLSLSTAINNTHMQCQLYRHNRSERGTNCMGQYFPEQSVMKLSMLINMQVHYLYTHMFHFLSISLHKEDCSNCTQSITHSLFFWKSRDCLW